MPAAIAILNKEITSINFLPWANEHVNQIGLTMLAIAGLNCLYILYRNYQTGQNSRSWYVFASIMAMLFLGYFYLGLSLSHAGF